MRLSDLWLLYEADKRILGFSQHTLKAYSLQMKVLIRELGNLVIEEVTLTLLKDGFSGKAFRTIKAEQLRTSHSVHQVPISLCD